MAEEIQRTGPSIEGQGLAGQLAARGAEVTAERQGAESVYVASQWQLQGDAGSGIGVPTYGAFQLHTATHVLHDGINQRQPQSGALARILSGIKWIEDLSLLFGGDAATVIFNMDGYPFV